MRDLTAAAPTPFPASLAGVESGFAVQAGSILVDLNAGPPKSLLLGNQSLPSGWGLIEDPSCVTGKEMTDAGWNLFFLAGEIKATVFGMNRSDAVRAALNRLIRKVKSEKCNSFEVARVSESSFLGISRVSIYGHLRHLQKGRLLFGR